MKYQLTNLFFVKIRDHFIDVLDTKCHFGYIEELKM